MLATLLMAVAIPDAFGSKGLLFACSYVAIQVGRHAFLTFVSARAGTIERKRSGHILVWLSAAGVFWIAGAFVEDEARAAVWLVALAIDYLGPVALYRVPGWWQLDPEAWDVETTHFSERFQLFVIIALGESIVLIGVTAAELEIDAARLTRARARVRGYCSSLVAVLRLRRTDLATTPGAHRQDDVARPRRLHVPPRCADRGHHRVGRRRRARDRPSDRRIARGRGRRARRGAGDLPARTRALPSADGRDALLEAAGRGGRVRRRGRSWLGAAGSSRSPACSSPCSWA